MPLAEWQDTKSTLHRFAQVVGKIRLAASVRRNRVSASPGQGELAEEELQVVLARGAQVV